MNQFLQVWVLMRQVKLKLNRHLLVLQHNLGAGKGVSKVKLQPFLIIIWGHKIKQSDSGGYI
jgi:hypothetical protein